MKKLFIISLLSLMLIPLLWNGISFLHYVMEHTHTFCASEENHEHQLAGDCHTICQITPTHDKSQLPNKIEFYKLKQYVTAYTCLPIQSTFSNQLSTSTAFSFLYGRIISEDIFRPPIS
ncbi:MAG: hypothetical protein AB8H03_16865 [Saprospiraceae bacterium]